MRCAALRLAGTVIVSLPPRFVVTAKTADDLAFQTYLDRSDSLVVAAAGYTGLQVAESRLLPGAWGH